MPSIRQQPQHLEEQLQAQLQFLTQSAQSYDAGVTIEAKRIAVAVRILVHDTRNSTSLLRQMNLKSDPPQNTDMEFVDTSRPRDPHNLLERHSFNGLVATLIANGRSKYIAPLNEPSHGYIRLVPFADWWSRVVFIDTSGNEFTRRDLVLYIANQDGGAHVDPELDERYYNLSRNNSIGWVIVRNGQENDPAVGVVHASMRQLAHEMLLSVAQVYPQWFGPAKK